MLRVKVKQDSLIIVQMLQDYNMLENYHETLCFNFDFSFYAHEELESTINDTNMNKLIRTDWVGTHESSGKFDTTKGITAVMEYEKSLA